MEAILGRRIDRAEAAERLRLAVDWARSDRPVPEYWVGITRAMQAAPSKTYTPALGTALLAKATDGEIDPLSIKETYSERTYSQRTLCHNLLVPAAVEYGFSIRNTGREPLNNQPFFRYDHINLIDRVNGRSRESLDELRQALSLLDSYSEDEALAGLAAFVRVRYTETPVLNETTYDDISVEADQLVDSVTHFLDEGVDRPRRTQAVVAAAFDMIYPDIVTRRINDPSRDLPGDVQAMVEDRCIMSAEARAKAVPVSEVRSYVASLRSQGISRGFVVVIHPSHQGLRRDELRSWAWSTHHVVLDILESASDLAWAILTWSQFSVEDVLQKFHVRVRFRLREIEAAQGSIENWDRYFTEPG